MLKRTSIAAVVILVGSASLLAVLGRTCASQGDRVEVVSDPPVTSTQPPQSPSKSLPSKRGHELAKHSDEDLKVMDKQLEKPPVLRLSEEDRKKILKLQNWGRTAVLENMYRSRDDPSTLDSQMKLQMRRRTVALNDIVIDKLRRGDYRVVKLHPSPKSTDKIHRPIVGWTTIDGIRYAVVVDVVLAQNRHYSDMINICDEIDKQESSAYVRSFNSKPIAERRKMILDRDKIKKAVRDMAKKGGGKKQGSIKELLRKIQIPPIYRVDRINWIIY